MYYDDQASNFILPQLHAEIQRDQAKNISVNMMKRIFTKFMQKRFDTWNEKALPIKKYKKLI